MAESRGRPQVVFCFQMRTYSATGFKPGSEKRAHIHVKAEASIFAAEFNQRVGYLCPLRPRWARILSTITRPDALPPGTRHALYKGTTRKPPLQLEIAARGAM
jgi:hypothetical protein